jgi:transposase
MRHLTGDSRQQATLLPDTLDDYVDEDHPVRVIDAFVDSLSMKSLGFSKAETQVTGRKPYKIKGSEPFISSTSSISS